MKEPTRRLHDSGARSNRAQCLYGEHNRRRKTAASEAHSRQAHNFHTAHRELGVRDYMCREAFT